MLSVYLNFKLNPNIASAFLYTWSWVNDVTKLKFSILFHRKLPEDDLGEQWNLTETLKLFLTEISAENTTFPKIKTCGNLLYHKLWSPEAIKALLTKSDEAFSYSRTGNASFTNACTLFLRKFVKLLQKRGKHV